MNFERVSQSTPNRRLHPNNLFNDFGNINQIDEHTIIYSKLEAGVGNIWSQSIDGGPAKQLTRFSSLWIWGIAMSPDHKHFAIVRGSYSNDLILIKNFR